MKLYCIKCGAGSLRLDLLALDSSRAATNGAMSHGSDALCAPAPAQAPKRQKRHGSRVFQKKQPSHDALTVVSAGDAWNPNNARAFSGPTTVEEAMLWPRWLWQVVQRLGPQRATALTTHLSNAHMTSHFSGIGCAEMAFDLLKQEGELLGTVRRNANSSRQHCHHACDINQLCRSTLADVASHVFGDVLDRLPPRLRECIAELVEVEGQDTGVDVAEAKRRHARILDLLVQFYTSRFDRAATGACETHHRLCPLYADARQQEGGITMNVAGTPCVAWSAIGLRGQDSHSSHVLFLSWLAERLAVREHLIVHECTEQFPAAMIAEVLGSAYDVYTFLVNPSWMGWPVERLRRYTLCLLRGSVAFVTDTTEFNETFTRTVNIGPAAVCAATEADVRKTKAEFAARLFVDPSRVDWEGVLSARERTRLEVERQRHQQHCQREGPSDWVCDLNQSEKVPRGQPLCPTLLKNGIHWVMSLGRLMTGQEHMHAQCLPVFAHTRGPYSFLLTNTSTWSTAQCKRAAGNGLNLMSFGCFLGWVLSAVRLVDVAASPGRALEEGASREVDHEADENDELLLRDSGLELTG